MSLKPSKIYYGWWIVASSFFITLYAGGIVVFGFTAFFEPIASEMGWSYTQVSLAASLRGIEMGLLAPLAGILVDRWGPKRLVFGGGIIIAMGLLMLSQANTIGMFYGSFVIIAIGMSTCVSTVMLTIVGNWFEARVGIASGIAVSGFGFGGLLVPLIVKLIEVYDWRTTLIIFAFGILVTVLPLSLLLKQKPKQPDNSISPQTNNPDVSLNSKSDVITTSQNGGIIYVLKSRTFWHMSLALACQFMGISAVTNHIMPYLSSVKISKSFATLAAAVVPLGGVVGRLLSGWLVDKFDSRRVTAIMLALSSLGLLCFEFVSVARIWLLIVFALLYPLVSGGSSILRASMVRRYFGRFRFGTFFGMQTGIMFVGGYIGPPLAGWIYDTWGSYQGAWLGLAGVVFLGTITILTIPRAGVSTQTDSQDLLISS